MLSLLFFSIYPHFSSAVLTLVWYGLFCFFFLALVINILNFCFIDWFLVSPPSLPVVICSSLVSNLPLNQSGLVAKPISSLFALWPATYEKLFLKTSQYFLTFFSKLFLPIWIPLLLSTLEKLTLWSTTVKWTRTAFFFLPRTSRIRSTNQDNPCLPAQQLIHLYLS